MEEDRMLSELEDENVKMKPRLRSSILAIAAGLTAFFFAGGIVFGAIYLALIYFPQPSSWMTLRLNIEGAYGFLASAVVGSIVSGCVTACVAKSARFVHSAVVFGVLCALHQVYIFWGPDTLWDTLYGPLLTALGCLPFLALGTWIGIRKGERSKGRS
jgi:hypothetical protein